MGVDRNNQQGTEKIQHFGQPVTLASRDLLQPYFDANPQRSSGQGFASLYMWSQQRFEVIDGYLCLVGQGWFGQDYEGPFLYPPLALDGRRDPYRLRRVILEVKEQLWHPEDGFRIYNVPRVSLPLFDEALAGLARVFENRASWDYIYRRSDLENLAGRKYGKKRNHLNYFKATYDYAFETIQPHHLAELDEALDRFIQSKCERDKADELLYDEAKAVRKVLPVFREIGMFGGLIRIEGQVQAFTLAHRHTEDTVEVTIEKANCAYRGLYQAINRDFVASLPPEVLYINREEDMGIEGLRQAKKSYYPCRMLEVFGYAFDA